MSTPKRSSLPGLYPVQQPKQSPHQQLFKPTGAKSQMAAPVTALRQPSAPPAYRPQTIPKVLQTKSSKSYQPPVATSGHKPVAPPPYRPQPTPKVLQTKLAAAGRVNQPGRAPVAPTASRPHPTPRHLQMKEDGIRRVFPLHHTANPASQVARGNKFGGSSPSHLNPAMRHAPMHSTPVAKSIAPESIVVQRSPASIHRLNSVPAESRPGLAVTSRGALTFTRNGQTVQLKGDVIQGDFWGAVGYVYDAISGASIIATIIGAIASAASAGGLGWLAPFFIPIVGTLVQEILKIEDEERGHDKLTLHGRKEKYLEVISHLVNGLTGVIGILVGSGAVTAGAAVAGVAAFIMIVLEILRINIIDRETIYGFVKKKLSRNEAQPLLASNI